MTLTAEPQAIVSLAPSNTEIVCARRRRSCRGRDRLRRLSAEVVDIDKAATMARSMSRPSSPPSPTWRSPRQPADALRGHRPAAHLGLSALVLNPSRSTRRPHIEFLGTAIAAGRGNGGGRDDGRTHRAVERPSPASSGRGPSTRRAFRGHHRHGRGGLVLRQPDPHSRRRAHHRDAPSTAIRSTTWRPPTPSRTRSERSPRRTPTPESVAVRPGWDVMTAAQDDRVVVVTEDVVIMRPGPRSWTASRRSLGYSTRSVADWPDARRGRTAAAVRDRGSHGWRSRWGAASSSSS